MPTAAAITLWVCCRAATNLFAHWRAAGQQYRAPRSRTSRSATPTNSLASAAIRPPRAIRTTWFLVMPSACSTTIASRPRFSSRARDRPGASTIDAIDPNYFAPEQSAVDGGAVAADQPESHPHHQPRGGLAPGQVLALSWTDAAPRERRRRRRDRQFQLPGKHRVIDGFQRDRHLDPDGPSTHYPPAAAFVQITGGGPYTENVTLRCQSATHYQWSGCHHSVDRQHLGFLFHRH